MLRKILLNLRAILRVYSPREIPLLLRELRLVRRTRPLLGSVCPNVTNISLPTAYHPHNGCILREGDQWLVAVRAINYTVTPILGRIRAPGGNDSVDSRTWFVRLDHNLQLLSTTELDDTPYRGPQSLAKNGLEDPRAFRLDGQIWCLWTAGQILGDDWENVTSTMALGRIDGSRILDFRYLDSPHHRSREKNWMPWVITNPLSSKHELRLIYSISTMETYLCNSQGLQLINKSPNMDQRLKGYSGGSPLIPYEGGYLCAVHYAARAIRMASLKLTEFFYIQRLVHIAADFSILAISREFFLEHKGLEFCAGIALTDAHLLMSYSIRDCESHVMALSIAQLDALFQP
jgi:hypothetical protein